MSRDLIRALGIAVGTVLLVGAAPAQELRQRTAFVETVEPGMRHRNVTAFAPQGGTFAFIGANAGMEGKVVKGAPYSAEGVTETEQTLADGTKITKKTTSKIYRDSQGRTRREMTLGAVGPWAAEGEAPTTITINDPVAGRIYVMRKGDSKANAIDVIHSEPNVELKELTVGDGKDVTREVKIVRKRVSRAAAAEVHEAHDVEVVTDPEANVWVQREHAGGGEHTVRLHDFTSATGNALFVSDRGAKTEDLGERIIEGVVAKGTRLTQTIPEGKIGNDRPINITTERWYSDELGTLVLSKTDNPMSGNITFKLSNISRAEPSPTLFEIDDDIEVHEGQSIHRRIKVHQ